jgi:hypothetical protein
MCIFKFFHADVSVSWKIERKLDKSQDVSVKFHFFGRILVARKLQKLYGTELLDSHAAHWVRDLNVVLIGQG